MCGIAGIVSLADKPVPTDQIKPMCDVQAHRGPDDAGYAFFQVGDKSTGDGGYWCGFTDPEFRHFNEHLPTLTGQYARDELGRRRYQLAFGHRRLSIQDLSHYGHQPMSNSDRRYWVVFNGEIYNFPDLRKELEEQGYIFRTRCDTEVILHGWKQWGFDCLEKLNGMFALALYDRQENTLTLARDRFGVKPLYYAVTNDYFLFASETKGILASGLHRAAIHPGALVEYFTFQNTLGRQTLFEGVEILPPGAAITLKPGNGRGPTSRMFHEQFPAASETDGDETRLREQVAESFSTAVRRQLISDVEVGSYLSGGMDSGSIVSVAGRSIPRLVTFTGGFDLTNVDGIEQGFDERGLAEQLSYLLQTEHYAVVLHAGDMPAAMEKITWHMDDPRVGMCHQNWYVAKLASRFVKVCLAGAGGDELFAGYPWRYRHIMDGPSPTGDEDAYFRYWNRLLEPSEQPGLFAIGEYSSAAGRARQMFQDVLRDAPAPRKDLSETENAVQRALYFEFRTFLHGFLVTEDHIGMAHSLESRVPFLDNDLADLAWRIRPKWKLDTDSLRSNSANEHNVSTDGKIILRQAMENFLPVEFTRQHKQGFSPPDENWFRGPSMDYIQSILYDPRTRQRPWFDQTFVQARLEEHFAGRRNNRLLIWSLLSFEWLQRHWVDKTFE
ncbi:MAG: asparagine synthase (glutamine-hydrolyzing) [Phycisphaerae bacterium]|nr:asparagine synthase (glutamine-hydrolyzing) [Phycisphaerae bacterium]